MNPEEMIFEEFFAERMKHKGLTLKKLAELTGISPRHLNEIARGNFSALPSAPYARGYLIRLGRTLDFDGGAWWQRIKEEGRLRNSGSHDALPRNRFVRKSPARLIVSAIVIVIVMIYGIAQFPRIIGKPTVTVTYPSTASFTTDTNLVTLAGTATNADSLSVNGDMVTVNPDKTWQKNVLLQSGENTFDIHAKKFLGGQSDVTEEITYDAPAIISTTTENGSSTTTSPEATSSNASGSSIR